MTTQIVETRPISAQEIVSAIKASERRLIELEDKSVVEVVKIAKWLYTLKIKCNRREFKDHLKELGYDRQRIRRLLAIGKSWWTAEVLQEADFLQFLPVDIQKLEWMAKLSEEQLNLFLRELNPRKAPRGEVVMAAQAMLGIIVDRPRKKVTSEKLEAIFESSMDRILDALDNLDTEDARYDILTEILSKLEEDFAEAKESLQQVLGDGVEADDEATPLATDGGEASTAAADSTTEAVAPAAPQGPAATPESATATEAEPAEETEEETAQSAGDVMDITERPEQVQPQRAGRSTLPAELSNSQPVEPPAAAGQPGQKRIASAKTTIDTSRESAPGSRIKNPGQVAK